MKRVYCQLPYTRMKIDPNGIFQSCCFQGKNSYGNLLTDNLTIEDAYKSTILDEVKKSVSGDKFHSSCVSRSCPYYHKKTLHKKWEVDELSKYPEEIELGLPASFCNIGGTKPTPDTACIMCPRSDMEWMDSLDKYNKHYNIKWDNTEILCEKIKPAMPYLKFFTVLGISEPFWKNKIFDIFDILEYKKYKENIFFWTFSNGTIFNERIQDKFLDSVEQFTLAFSIDAGSRENYINIRRMDYYNRVKNNLSLFCKKLKDIPYINQNNFDRVLISHNINLLNIHEVEDMVRFAHEVGVDSVNFTLTYETTSNIKIDKKLLCNKDNWEIFYEGQQKVEKVGRELGYKVDFFVPLHGGYLKG